ncbi:tail terminator [Arthrobacter phage VResidence]|uniref:Tail terminator n=1 Tax=Arthrobacter phage VResidence TaxID=2927294 RepID=A0A9X9K3U8_9CAUD|nr:tail terminator [Arthrobacter phage VResidence]
MKPAITFPDAQLAVRDLLRALLASRTEPYALGATVSTREIPSDVTAAQATLPYVQVRSDGKFRDSRLDGRATVRVLAYGADVGQGENLAALCEALLLSASSADVRGSTSVMGPMPTDDPENGLPLSYFTITARLQPRQLT